MNSFNELPEAVKILWAKSTSKEIAEGEGREWEGYSILCHMLDVAAVAEVILEQEPRNSIDWVSQKLGIPFENTVRWVSALIGLHDFGKSIPGFQKKWEQGKENDKKTGLTFPSQHLSANKHDYALPGVLEKLFKNHFESKCHNKIRALITAISGHHGYFPRGVDVKNHEPAKNEDSIWKETRQTLFECYWNALMPEDCSTIGNKLELPIITWIAGLTSVADWIGSNQDWFSPETGPRDASLIGHFEKSREIAKHALSEIGWSNFSPLLRTEQPIEESLTKILASDTPVTPRPLQAVGHELLKDLKEPALMIVEAPMGEGKTELAFLSYLHLQAINQHRGLYVALPTQATSNAMFDRTCCFLKSYSEEVKLDIQLIHGGALLNEKIQDLRSQHAGLESRIDSSVWFSQRKRGLLSSYGAGTIDQALYSVLPVKHHFVRLWGLANKVVVLDEVHAYDTYTSDLIQALLRWLKSMNCSVILMSATLPEKDRLAFVEAWKGSASQIEAAPYPRISLISESREDSKHAACRSMAPIHVSGIDENLETIADEAIKKLECGGCGVVIVNTVKRAQQLFLLLKSQINNQAELMLFHARYPADERSDKEKKILARFGKSTIEKGRPKKALLIATQVVEQSLDLDFDFMISDLAPVDLLLQRSGRLHRHERARPESHTVPRLIVAGLLKDRFPDVVDTHWEYVYDPYILYRTWAVIRNEQIWQLPRDIDRLVQRVYGNDELEIPDELVRSMDNSYGKSRAIDQNQKRSARHVTLQPDAEWIHYKETSRGDEDDGSGLKYLTRLGDPSIAVVPIFVSEEGWRLMPEDAPFDPDSELNEALVKRIYMRQLSLSSKGIVKEILNAKTPEGFKNSLLKHIIPLKLIDGELEIGALTLRLDEELGITY